MNSFRLSDLLVFAWVATIGATVIAFVVLLVLAAAEIPTAGTDLAKRQPFLRVSEMMSGRYDQYRSAVRLRTAAKVLLAEWVVSIVGVATMSVLEGAGVLAR